MALSKRLRYEVLRRDGFMCRYCGATAEQNQLQVDHVVPEVLGGETIPSNLIAACIDCNAGKSSVSGEETVIEEVSARQLAWQAALVEAQARFVAGDPPYVEERAAFDAEWRRWAVNGQPVPRDPRWHASITTFLNAGLPMDVLLSLIPAAMAPGVRERWPYFCGCCWRTIDRIHEIALEILAEEADA